MTVIFRLTGGELPTPVEGEAQTLQLRLHVGDVGARPFAGMNLLFHRGVFGGHTEGIPPHRVQHLIPAHSAKPRQHVAHSVVADMADVDAPGWIREHLQHIRARLAARVVGTEALLLVPDVLPFGVCLKRVEAPLHIHVIPVRSTLAWTLYVPENGTTRSTCTGRRYAADLPQSSLSAIAMRRRSRALVRMISSSFCTVAACTGASTHWPPCITCRLAATRRASARRS